MESFLQGRKKKTTCDLWGLIFDNQLGFNWKLSYGRCCARFWEGKAACLHFHSQHGKKFQIVKAQCWSVRAKIFSICPSLALVAGIENQIVSFAPGSPTHSRNRPNPLATRGQGGACACIWISAQSGRLTQSLKRLENQIVASADVIGCVCAVILFITRYWMMQCLARVQSQWIRPCRFVVVFFLSFFLLCKQTSQGRI